MFQIEIDKDKSIIAERLKIEKEFDSKIELAIGNVMLNQSKQKGTFSCVDCIEELINMCKNTNELVYLSLQVGRVFEDEHLGYELMKKAESRNYLN